MAFFRDLRHGARVFARQPGTTALAVVTLSLGIGANAVIFSLLHAVLFKPLPFANADRLVGIVDAFQTDGTRSVPPTVPELLDIRRASTELERLSFYDMRDVQTTGAAEPTRAFAARVESAFLGILGVQPALGRLFVDGEGTPGQENVLILTDGFWRRHFAAATDVIGKLLIINGVPNTIVGVLPPEFSFDDHSPEPIELYVPFPMTDEYMLRSGTYVNVRRVTAIGRLKAGASRAQAAAEARAIAPRPSARGPLMSCGYSRCRRCDGP